MTLQQRERLEQAGIDVEEALERFMNREALMLKFLLRFPEEASYRMLCEAMEQRNTSGAFEAAHALKGVSGNLSMKRLYSAVSVIVEDLREENLERAKDRMSELEQTYGETVQAIQSLV